jgi:hypothetical protein
MSINASKLRGVVSDVLKVMESKEVLNLLEYKGYEREIGFKSLSIELISCKTSFQSL